MSQVLVTALAMVPVVLLVLGKPRWGEEAARWVGVDGCGGGEEEEE